jgi:hypothetical protein
MYNNATIRKPLQFLETRWAADGMADGKFVKNSLRTRPDPRVGHRIPNPEAALLAC